MKGQPVPRVGAPCVDHRKEGMLFFVLCSAFHLPSTSNGRGICWASAVRLISMSAGFDEGGRTTRASDRFFCCVCVCVCRGGGRGAGGWEDGVGEWRGGEEEEGGGCVTVD